MNIMLYPVLSALHGTPGITHQQQDFHIQPATNQDRKIKQKYLQISVADPRLAVLCFKNVKKILKTRIRILPRLKNMQTNKI